MSKQIVKRSALLLALSASAALSLFVAPAQASENFCVQCSVAPYGQPGDQVTASNAQTLYGINLTSYEHSGCADAVDNGGNLVQSWICTSGAYSSVELMFTPNRSLRGTVRNNTTGDSNHLGATQFF